MQQGLLDLDFRKILLVIIVQLKFKKKCIKCYKRKQDNHINDFKELKDKYSNIV